MKYTRSTSTIQWRMHFLWVLLNSYCLGLRCPKCLHMESNDFYASMASLPSNPNCTTGTYAQLSEDITITCPEESGNNNVYMCGLMNGNLTANIKLFGMFVTVKGSVTYRDCVFVERHVVPVGCRENLIKPMENALLKELGPSIPDVTVSTFRGISCLSYASNGDRAISSTDGNIETTGQSGEWTEADEITLSTTPLFNITKKLTSATARHCSQRTILYLFLIHTCVRKLITL